MTELKTGRAFQLKTLQNDTSTNKVTIGFKTTAIIKIALYKESQSLGLSLSEYVAAIMDLRHEEKLVLALSGNTENEMAIKKENTKLKETIEHLKGELECVEKDLDWYLTNSKVDALWEKYDGQTINIPMPDGSVVPILVDSPKDVYEIILSSFK